MAEQEISIAQQFKDVFAEKNFRILFSARFISNIGNGIGPIALAFGVLGLPEGNATSLSLVMFARTLPLILLVLFGGVIADRYGRARLVGSTDMILSLIVLFEAFLFISGQATVGRLVILGIVTGILHALWWPAFPGIMPQVIPESKLQSANSVNGFGVNGANVLGYSLGGILVVLLGPGLAIAIDGLSFLVAGILIWQLRKFDKPGDVEKQQPVFKEMKDGWKEVKIRPWIIACISAYSLVIMCYEPLLAVLGPYHAKTELSGPPAWAIIAGAHSLGMLFGVILAMRLRPKHPLFIGMLGTLVFAFWPLTTALNLPIAVIAISAFATGVGFDLFFVFWITSLQTHIPKESLSRVVSYDAFGSFFLGPLGLVIAGPLVELIGIQETLLISSAIVVIAVLAGLSVKSVRTLQPIS